MQSGNFNEQERIARQLEAVEGRFEELSIRITLPEVISDTALFTSLMREHSELSPLNDIAVQFRTMLQQIHEAHEMLDDPDMADMAKEELNELEPAMEKLTHEAKIALLPKDPDDRRNVILEVRAGAGGDEAGLFGAELLRMYQHYAAAPGWDFKNVFEKMKFESGVHRVQRVPVTESGGRIHTSTATVAVLPEVEDVEIEINMNDLKIDTYRASGAGGQHVNRTDSAVRITHLPTGVVVTSQDQRSQIQNREQAMRVLKTRLYEMEREKQDSSYSERRRLQVGTGDRSERIRTYNFPQGRVTDHRIGLTLYKIDEIINGSLDDIINALTLADQEARMAKEV